MNLNIKSDNKILRKKAEKLLEKLPSKVYTVPSEGEMMKLIYELEVSQIELELQNEELLRIRKRLKKNN